MRTAVVLHGDYSDIYKLNNYVGDLYFITHTGKSKTIPGLTWLVLEETIPPKNYRLSNRDLRCRQILFEKSISLVEESEIKSGQQYDAYIFASFRDILDYLPEKPGFYYTDTVCLNEDKIEEIPRDRADGIHFGRSSDLGVYLFDPNYPKNKYTENITIIPDS